MSKTTEKLEIRVVGFDKRFVRHLRNSLVHRSVTFEWLSRGVDVVLRSKGNKILLIEMKGPGDSPQRNWRRVLTRFASLSPLVYFAEKRSRKEEFHAFRTLLEAAGAMVLEGEKGKEHLVDWLKAIAEADPADVITSVQISDEGLRVIFADGTIAGVPFSEVKRLAETDDIRWDEIRIGGDRTFITVGTGMNEAVPIPSDILARYSKAQKSAREKKAEQERRLTAKTFGQRLRRLREQSQLSQEQLAEKMGKSRWTIIRIENGEYLPKVADLQKIASGLGKTVEEMLG